MKLYIPNHLQKYFSPQQAFDQILALRGESYREQRGRTTQRIFIGDSSYFIKRHLGVGWKEIWKNLFQLRLPILSAKTEWQALEKLKTLGVHTPEVIAYGERGLNPARRQSFVLLQELKQKISLEDFTKCWLLTPPTFLIKFNLIRAVADIAMKIHQSGLTHRDFYLCHFLLDSTQCETEEKIRNLVLYLIDLHRTAVHYYPRRWIIKDLAGLYFSSKEIGLTSKDYYRFIRFYRKKKLRDILPVENNFWRKVRIRGDQLYQRHAS